MDVTKQLTTATLSVMTTCLTIKKLIKKTSFAFNLTYN